MDSALAPAASGVVKWPDAPGVRFDRRAGKGPDGRGRGRRASSPAPSSPGCAPPTRGTGISRPTGSSRPQSRPESRPARSPKRSSRACPTTIRGAFEVSVAGPGLHQLHRQAGGAPRVAAGPSHPGRPGRRRLAPRTRGETWVVDYSSPNTAKQMHVGHLRSAVIGEAISRLLAFTGARVVRDNHIGDWGTQYGKLIWACKRHLDEAALARDPIEEFERLYKMGNAAAESDPAVMEEARAELVKLQAGDPENLALWRRINEASLSAFQRDLRPARNPLRRDARRELLQRQGRARVRGARRPRHLDAERGRPGRLPPRAPPVQDPADDRAQVGRRRQLRDDRPGDDPLPLPSTSAPTASSTSSTSARATTSSSSS